VLKRLSLYVLVALTLIGVVALAGCKAAPKPASTANPAGQAQAQTPADQNAGATSQDQGAPAQEAQQIAPQLSAPGKKVKDVTKLVIKDQKVGTGAEALSGHAVLVHYTGWLTDGTLFDSSLNSGQPFQFTLGAGQVIKGWDQGVAGMKVGGVRQLIIPSAMGYGPAGSPPQIPGGATLVFEVQLLATQ